MRLLSSIRKSELKHLAHRAMQAWVKLARRPVVRLLTCVRRPEDTWRAVQWHQRGLPERLTESVLLILSLLITAQLRAKLHLRARRRTLK